MTEQHGKKIPAVHFSPGWSEQLPGASVRTLFPSDLALGNRPSLWWETHGDGDPTDLTNIAARPPRV